MKNNKNRIETIRCKLCGNHMPLHKTERIWDQGRKIIACQDCIQEDNLPLLGKFSCKSRINYGRLISV